MGVYGNIHGAFNGLGKPSIKLEFEDNEALLDFQRRMQEGGDNPDGDTPDGGGNFTQGEQVLDRLSRLATGRPYLKATPGGEVSNEEPVVWNEERQEFEPLEGYGDFYTVCDMRKRSRKEPGDVAANKNLQFTKNVAKTIKNFNHKFYLAAQAQQDRLGLFPNELEFDGKLYTKIALYDGKEGWHFYVDIFLPKKKNGKDILKGYTDKDRSFIDINKCINITPSGSNSFYAYIEEDYYRDLFSSVILSQYNILVARRKRYIEGNYDTSEIDKEIKYFIAYYSDPSKYQALHLQGYKIGYADYEAKKYTKPGLFDGVALGAPGDTYIITDTRKKPRKDLENTAALQKYDIRKFSGEELQKMQTDDPLLYEQIKSDMTGGNAQPTTTQNLVKQSLDDKRRSVADKIYAQIDELQKKNSDIQYKFNYRPEYKTIHPNKKAKIVSALKNSIEDLYNKADNLIRFYDIPKEYKNEFSKEELKLAESIREKIASYDEKRKTLKAKTGLDLDEIKNIDINDPLYKVIQELGLGRTAPAVLYNNIEILDFRGMQPTYRQLPNYDGFFKPAANKNSLKGWGLNDTKKLIADICRNHYKECAAIAKHLKADTKLQSAFNLWHWLHHNIRYEYDREGREEVRTPARTWQDRHRGVDCDCLSVFAWCVLKCMGYNPAFELAAFKNKPAYSHIYINLDGIVVDRVWYVFNSRPPFITKTELFKVGMLDNLGQLF